MTTLDTLGTAEPDRDEIADAALAMADFDAKGGDYAMALQWLAVAAQHRRLSREYRAKKATWTLARSQRPKPVRWRRLRRVLAKRLVAGAES